MKIIAVDDETLALNHLVEMLHEAVSDAEIYAFQSISEMLEQVKIMKFDIAFLDIEVRGKSGIEAALSLKKIQPYINIIFVTGHDIYMKDAFQMHASGYILKPYQAEDVHKELQELRHPIALAQNIITDRLVVQTFGNFEVFYQGRPVHFARSKSKELFAYLIDRKGASVTMAELASILWEEREYCRSLLNQLHSFLSDIQKQMRLLHQEDVIIKHRNSIAVNIEKVYCDYYQFLKGDVNAINTFTDEYMTNYSWAEFTVGSLYQIKKNTVKKLTV